MCSHWPRPIKNGTSGAFPLSDSDSFTDSYEMNKGSTGTDSDGNSYGQLLWKLLAFHLISTDIGAKLGTVAIGIRKGITIGIGVGSVETVLHITIIAICIRVGLGVGIGQWKHTIIQKCLHCTETDSDAIRYCAHFLGVNTPLQWAPAFCFFLPVSIHSARRGHVSNVSHQALSRA